jgi:hypothetical protein
LVPGELDDGLVVESAVLVPSLVELAAVESEFEVEPGAAPLLLELEPLGKLIAPCDTITPEALALPDWATTASGEPDPLASSEPDVVEPELLVPSPPFPLAAVLPVVGIVISAGSRPAAARAIG